MKRLYLFYLNQKFEFLVLKIPLQPSDQGKHLCIVKILEYLKIFRKIKIFPVLKPDLIRAVS